MMNLPGFEKSYNIDILIKWPRVFYKIGKKPPKRKRRFRSWISSFLSDAINFGYHRGFHSVFDQPTENHVSKNVSRNLPVDIHYVKVTLSGVGFNFVEYKESKSGRSITKSVIVITSGTSSTRVSLNDWPMDGTLDFILSSKDSKKSIIVYGTVATAVNEFSRNFLAIKGYNPFTRQGIRISHIHQIPWKEFVKNPDHVFSTGNTFVEKVKHGFYEDIQEHPLHPGTFELPYAFPDELPARSEPPFKDTITDDHPISKLVPASIKKYAIKMDLRNKQTKKATARDLEGPMREYKSSIVGSYADIYNKPSNLGDSYMGDFYSKDKASVDVFSFIGEEMRRKDLPGRYDPYNKVGFGDSSYESGISRSVSPQGTPRDNLDAYRVTKHGGVGNVSKRRSRRFNPVHNHKDIVSSKSRVINNRRGPFR